MMLPEAKVTVQRLGREGEPLVIIDNFTGQPDRRSILPRSAARTDDAGDGAGVWSFGRGPLRGGGVFTGETLPPAALSPRQRIPHHDHSDAGRIAIMHYLGGAETGGTAFYRHRRTGFEAITPEREAAYAAALAADEREFGPPPLGYPMGDGDCFEQIGAVEARVDRLALYRGRQLHSGIIPDPAVLSDDPARGRLTVNMFLFGS